MKYKREIAIAVVLLALTAFSIVTARTAHGTSGGGCHPSEARSTYVWYVPTYINTAVELIAHCDGFSSVWHVSFFDGLVEDGAQPDLWDWYGIQNDASLLLER